MDKTNDFSQSILQSSESASLTPLTGSISSSTNGTGFFDSLKNINTTTWILIIFILAFLGFNVFFYLAKGTQEVTDVFAPFLRKIFGTAAVVTGQTIDVSAEGAKAVVAGTAGAIESGLSTVQTLTPNGAVTASSIKGQPVNQEKQTVQGDQSTLNKALNTAQSQQQMQSDYQAHEASSSVHRTGEAGWCFIGNDRGFRSCAEVGVNDVCMSGDIFPSQEICMNPNLRP